MRSLLLICLWLLTSAVYAESCGSHLKKTETSGVATVECPGCTNLNDFASYGAAMLYSNNQYNRTYVTKGSTEVEVILRNSYRNTPLSVGIFGFSWNFRATNYAERLVDAFPRRGSVNGAPWNRQPVSTGSLKAKCNDIEKQQQAKVQQNDDLARLSQEVSSRGHGPSGDEVAHLTGRAPSNWFGRNSRYNYISCYTVWGPYGSTTRCPRSR